jgi:hypothetical protein
MVVKSGLSLAKKDAWAPYSEKMITGTTADFNACH